MSQDLDRTTAALILQATAAVTQYMRVHHLSRGQLADLMGVSPGRVSQVLSGAENMTLKTLASIAVALGAEITLDLEPGENGPHVSRSGEVELRPSSTGPGHQ